METFNIGGDYYDNFIYVTGVKFFSFDSYNDWWLNGQYAINYQYDKVNMTTAPGYHLGSSEITRSWVDEWHAKRLAGI